MEKKSAVAVFDDPQAARAAASDLNRSGFPANQTSVVNENLESKTKLHDYIGGTKYDTRGALRGVVAGAVVGFLLAGFLAWIMATALTTQPQGGWLGLAFMVPTGGIVGALAGGVLGWSVARSRIAKYQEEVEHGHPIVVARGDEVDANAANRVLNRTHAREVSKESGDVA